MIMTDTQIRAEADAGHLVSANYSPDSVDGCSYEFRAGDTAYRYDYDHKSTRQETAQIHIIYPFETVTLITLEKVRLTQSHFLLLFSKGSLFSLGLVPVCTGADPGFTGPLGVTLTNLSPRPVQIAAGTRIIKGVFFKLRVPAEKSYTGQHGDATMHWPYPDQYHMDTFDLATYTRHLHRFLPKPLVDAMLLPRSVRNYLRWSIGVFAFVATADVAAFFLMQMSALGWAERAFQLLSVVGSIASVVGLLLSLVALRATSHATS